MKRTLTLFALLLSVFCFAQNKIEREHRILKRQFPATQYSIAALGENVKKMKYYKEVDSSRTVYSLKFKKQRLHYQMDFTPEGQLTTISFGITEDDMESEVFENIIAELTRKYNKVRILKMQQQYKVTSKETEVKTFKNAFQNLMLPSNVYKLTVKSKNNGKKVNLHYFFDAKGSLISVKDVLPTNYDRVLY